MQLKTEKRKKTISRKNQKNTVKENTYKKEISKEFPNDMALQEVHLARKILLQKAKAENMSYIEYVKSLPNES